MVQRLAGEFPFVSIKAKLPGMNILGQYPKIGLSSLVSCPSH